MSLQLIAPWGELHPEELNSLGFKSTFGKRPTQALLSSDTLTLVNEDCEQILTWIYNNGRTENIPVTCISDSGVTFEYYLQHKGTVFTNSTVTMNILPRKGNLSFFENADNLTFELLFKKGVLPESLAVKTPFLIVRDNLVSETIILTVTGISLTLELIQVIKDISDFAAEALNVSPLQIPATILHGVGLSIKLVALGVALAQVINDLTQMYFPKLRYFKVCSFLTLLEVGCSYLGYTLDSQLINNIRRYHVLPVPLTSNKAKESFFEFLPDELPEYETNHYPSASDTVPTLGALIESIETMFNAETVVFDGVVKIEKRSTFFGSPIATIPSVLNDQANREDKWSFNDEDVWKRKVLQWQTDYQDLHTADSHYGTISEYSTEPISVTNQDLVDIAVAQMVDFPYSFGKRKNSLTRVENAVKKLFALVDNLVDIFSESPNYAGNVTDRIGSLVISQEQFSVTKLLYLGNDGKQPSGYTDYIHTTKIYDEYHLDWEIKVNAKKVFTGMPVPMTDYKFQQFAQNKYVVLEDTNETVELLSCVWEDRQHEATIDYKVFDNWASNTEVLKIY
jgi:hypothetical protein